MLKLEKEISLDKFHFNKEKKFLVISDDYLTKNKCWNSPDHHLSNFFLVIRSHVTGKEYHFVYDGKGAKRWFNNNRGYWILNALDKSCPVQQVYVSDGYNIDLDMFEPEVDDHVVS